MEIAKEAVKSHRRIMVNTKTGTVTSYSKLGPGHGIPLGFELLWDIDDQLISASRLIDRDNEDGTTLLKNLTEVLIEEALYQIVSWRIKYELAKKGETNVQEEQREDN